MTQVFSERDDTTPPVTSSHSAIDPHLQSSRHELPFRRVHIAILGTGFSGLGMAIQLKRRGYKDFVLIERAADIGGTWRDNTYPGCACDIQSHLYSFSFALNPGWSRKYAQQQEIRDYLRTCAKRFGIIPHIQWESELVAAAWDENEQCWQITTSCNRLAADILILGHGPLSEPSLPALPGIEDFKGVIFHSAQWRHDYNLTGKRVAVIGTGASAIQFVPQIQPLVDHLFLFQRTPPWIIPRLDGPIPGWHHVLYRLLPLAQRIVRARIYVENEKTALALLSRPDLLEQGMHLARKYLESQVPDPALRAKLTPQYLLGCKRILLSDDFYPALSSPNVDVVTERIHEVRAHSIVTEEKGEFEIDTILCGTGFHVTDAHLPRSIYGKGGRSLAECWQSTGPRAYLGTTIPGFPNLFLMIGPNTGLGHNSMVYMIESQISYILHCLRIMKQKSLQIVEVQPEIEESFNAELQQRMQHTAWMSGCTSWYLDASGRNTTIWPGFTFEFRRRTRRFDIQNYHVVSRK